MPRDRRTEANDWLDHADTDLRAAHADFAAEPPIIGDALFHAQQAVEKALKGYLVAHDVPFRATHDLRELSGLVLPLAPGLELSLRGIVRLGPYAVTFRYPGYFGVPPLDEALEDVKLARALVLRVKETLENEAAETPDAGSRRTN